MRTAIFLVLVGFILPLGLSAQKNSVFTPDPRLYDAFDAKYIDDIAATDTFWLLKQNFYLNNAAFFSTTPNVKEQDLNNIPTIHMKDSARFNIFLLERDQKIKRDYYTYTTYKVAEYPDLYLVFFPSHDYIENFNRFLKDNWQTK